MKVGVAMGLGILAKSLGVSLAASNPGPENSEIEKITKTDEDHYVSRAGYKLQHALSLSGVSVEGALCLDIGQSTGGFTDCLLQGGARHVVGVEVGHEQLVPRLRNDSRVTCLEGVNARDLPKQTLLQCSGDAKFDIAVMDVSFISQTKILPGLVEWIASGGFLLSLVKPQFELGAEAIGKGGLVKDASLYQSLEQQFFALGGELGLKTQVYSESPITGGDGNREFLWVAQLC